MSYIFIYLISIYFLDRCLREEKYLWNILLSMDQFVKILIYGGNPDVTISHVIGVKMRENRANKIEKSICCFLRKFENKHCEKSIEKDEKL